MKHCPNPDCAHLVRHGRASEFLDAVARCSDCGSHLLPGEVPTSPPIEFEDLCSIYETSDRVRAHLLRSLLEDAGIFARLTGDALQGAMGELPLTMLSIRVHVPAEDAEQAREIALQLDGS